MRVAAAWVLERTLASMAPVRSFLDGALGRFDPRDGALLRELVLGTLRWLRRLDHVLEQASQRPLDQVEESLLAPLRIAAYQLLFLRVPSYAVVDEAVEQAHSLTHRGGASFANGVLRRIARCRDLQRWPVDVEDPVVRLAIESSHPDFLVRRWLDQFGEVRTLAILEANNRPKAMQLLAFREKGGRELVAEELIDEGVVVEPTPWSPLGITVREGSPLGTTAFREGRLYVQDEASQLAALMPPPRGAERIFDATAAPGGKSFALMAWSPESQVLASDVDLGRLLTVRDNARRLGCRLPLVVADAGRPSLATTFDRVVADLPCSGTGTLRKHPEIKWRLSESELGRLGRLQRRILDGLAPLVAPDGHLVAITCSLERDENEHQVAAFLERHPAFELADLGAALEPPIVAAVEAPGRWRLDPGGDHDGFTVHGLRRRS